MFYQLYSSRLVIFFLISFVLVKYFKLHRNHHEKQFSNLDFDSLCQFIKYIYFDLNHPEYFWLFSAALLESEPTIKSLVFCNLKQIFSGDCLYTFIYQL